MKTFLLLTFFLGTLVFLGLGALSLATPSPAFTHFATDFATYRTVLFLLAGSTAAVFALSALTNRLKLTWI